MSNSASNAKIDELVKKMHSRLPPGRRLEATVCIDAIKKKYPNDFPNVDWSIQKKRIADLLGKLSKGAQHSSSSSSSSSDSSGSSSDEDGSSDNSESDIDDESNNSGSLSASEEDDDDDDGDSGANDAELPQVKKIKRTTATEGGAEQQPSSTTSCSGQDDGSAADAVVANMIRFMKRANIPLPSDYQSSSLTTQQKKQKLESCLIKHGANPNDLGKRGLLKYEARKELEDLQRTVDITLDKRARKGRPGAATALSDCGLNSVLFDE